LWEIDWIGFKYVGIGLYIPFKSTYEFRTEVILKYAEDIGRRVERSALVHDATVD